MPITTETESNLVPIEGLLGAHPAGRSVWVVAAAVGTETSDTGHIGVDSSQPRVGRP